MPLRPLYFKLNFITKIIRMLYLTNFNPKDCVTEIYHTLMVYFYKLVTESILKSE